LVQSNILNPVGTERRALASLFSFCSHSEMVEWGELSFKVVGMEKVGQEVLARAGNFMVDEDFCFVQYESKYGTQPAQSFYGKRPSF
jgi:hypothetical protein